MASKFALPVSTDAPLKLSDESATAQVVRILDFYNIDIDKLPEKAAPAVTGSAEKLVQAFREGRLDIKTDKGFTVVQTLSSGQTLEYGELSGETKLETDKVPNGESFGKVYALLGSLSGIGKDGIAKLKGVDLSTAENLGMVFLNS